MNSESLVNLARIVSKLKNELKCSICLDIIQDNIELECGHKYCNTCIIAYKCTLKQGFHCPICKIIIKKRTTLYKDSFADYLGKFVFSVCNRLKKTYNCEVESIGKPLDNKNSHDKEEEFDRLLLDQCNILSINKKGTKKTYNRAALQPNQNEVLDFQYAENRMSVLHWLHDTRNIFDRLTQTQNLPDKEANYSTTDLPSVSQFKSRHSMHSLPKMKPRSRPRSLDIQIKKTDTRRFSMQTEVPYVRHIKKINTEEEDVVHKAKQNVILNFVEDEYLNKLETELRVDIPESASKKIESVSAEISPNSSWNRITEMKKTLKKPEKTPKQLNITLQSTQNSNSRKRISNESLKKLHERNKQNIVVENNNNHDMNIKDIETISIHSDEAIEYLQLTQKISCINNDEKINTTLLDIDFSTSFKSDNLNTETVLNLFHDLIRKWLNIPDISLLKLELEKIRKYVENNLNILNKNILPLSEKQTQTDIIEIKSAEVQTVVETNNTEAQTDSLSIANPTPPKPAAVVAVRAQQSEIEMLPSTWDNLKFETQEAVRDSKKLSRKLFHNSIKDIPKRRLNPDECEENVPKKKRNRFEDDDLSVVFESNVFPSQNAKHKLESLGSESMDYENYLAEVIKKYDNGNLLSPKPTEDVEGIADGIIETEDIIDRVNKNIQNLAKEKDIPRTPELEMHENIEYETSTDIIGKTESLEPVLMKSKKDILNKALIVENVIPEKCVELDDSLDDADFANIELSEEQKNNNTSTAKKITILENIKLTSEHKVEENDDLFSDEDIVETTPQKPHKWQKSQIIQSPDLLTNIENVDFDFALLIPPPAFRDQLSGSPRANNEAPSVLEELKTSLTPDLDRNISQTAQKTHTSFTLSPLTNISRLSPRRHNLLTSTPNQKSILNYVRRTQPSRKPCIACTRLNKEQILLINQLASKKLATYSSIFDKSVTHMVVNVDKDNCVKDYTMKFMCAVASGIWVLSFEWIEACLESNAVVSEEAFEVLDDSGNPGPRTSRLTRKENPLFKDFQFFCAEPFYSTTRQEVESVIRNLGGDIASRLSELSKNKVKISLIITESRASQDFEVYEKWLDTYKVATIDIEWLSKSVGRYKILSIRPYIWCLDDNLNELGYPDFLIEDVPPSTC